MEKVKVAINGFGRIGRLVYRQIYTMENIDVVAVNDLTSPVQLAHLLKYDSSQGRFPGEVSHTDNSVVVDGKNLIVYAEKDPAQIPWQTRYRCSIGMYGCSSRMKPKQKHI